MLRNPTRGLYTRYGDVRPLIAAIDDPTTGTRPVGPGRTTIALAGLLGGVVIGAGVLFLSLPAAPRGEGSEAVAAPPSWLDSPSEARRPAFGESGRLSFEKALAKSLYPRTTVR